MEAKVKTTREIEGKVRKRTDTYVLLKDFFAEAEYDITSLLTLQRETDDVQDFEIQSLKISSIKEIVLRYTGEHSYIATLKDTWIDDIGNEKSLRYKVLLWANNLSDAISNTREIAQEGYNMVIEGVKEVNYILINNEQGRDMQEDS